jgi:hypothetical protein
VTQAACRSSRSILGARGRGRRIGGAQDRDRSVIGTRVRTVPRGGRASGIVLALAALFACARERRTMPTNTAGAGIAIAVYALGDHATYAVIDDRRWVEVAGRSLVLEQVDPRAALPSLVIEPLGGAALDIGACARDRLPGLASAAPDGERADARGADASGGASAASDSRGASSSTTPVFTPVLRCAVRGAPGRRLVRILYVVPGLAYRASHDVVMTVPDGARVTSRFSLATPAWKQRAELTLYDGMPGTQQPPREIARGPIVLDGGIAVLATPTRAVAAQLRWIYDGAVHRHGEVGPRDPRWQRESHPAVWVWLELRAPALAPGPVRAHVELPGEPVRDIDVPALGPRTLANALGLPLWVDDQLRGRRDRWSQSREDATLVDRFAVSIANLGTSAREVWIDEALRPARRHTVRRVWPGDALEVKGMLRMKLMIPPGKIERGGFEVEYEL